MKTPGKTRQKVKDYILNQNTLNGWTESLVLPDDYMNMLDDKQFRKCLEGLLIGAYYSEYRKLESQYRNIPAFLNKPR